MAIARLLDGIRTPVLRVAIAHSPRLQHAGLVLAGAFDATWARATYLSLASFHAYLELAFLGRWLVGASAR